LVGEDGGEQLGPIVIEAVVPRAVMKIEAGLEPIVERFDGLTAAAE
jgi:hypothetical protein